MKIRKFESLNSEIALTNGNAPVPVCAGGVCGSVKQYRPMTNEQTAASTKLSALFTWSLPERRQRLSSQPISTQDTAPHMRTRK